LEIERRVFLPRGNPHLEFVRGAELRVALLRRFVDFFRSRQRDDLVIFVTEDQEGARRDERDQFRRVESVHEARKQLLPGAADHALINARFAQLAGVSRQRSLERLHVRFRLQAVDRGIHDVPEAGDADYGDRYADPVVGDRGHPGFQPPLRHARHADPSRIDVVARDQVIDRAEVVENGVDQPRVAVAVYQCFLNRLRQRLAVVALAAVATVDGRNQVSLAGQEAAEQGHRVVVFAPTQKMLQQDRRAALFPR
jgi:hypothetical protein